MKNRLIKTLLVVSCVLDAFLASAQTHRRTPWPFKNRDNLMIWMKLDSIGTNLINYQFEKTYTITVSGVMIDGNPSVGDTGQWVASVIGAPLADKYLFGDVACPDSTPVPNASPVIPGGGDLDSINTVLFSALTTYWAERADSSELVTQGPQQTFLWRLYITDLASTNYTTTQNLEYITFCQRFSTSYPVYVEVNCRCPQTE